MLRGAIFGVGETYTREDIRSPSNDTAVWRIAMPVVGGAHRNPDVTAGSDLREFLAKIIPSLSANQTCPLVSLALESRRTIN